MLLVESTIEFSYDSHPYTYRVSEGFSIDVGEIICVSGVSGSGKSTILTMLAGLRRLSKGRIRYKLNYDQCFTLVPGKIFGPVLWGQIGFSFQRPELLNSLTVEGNMKLAL